jgi:hypothetical protein
MDTENNNSLEVNHIAKSDVAQDERQAQQIIVIKKIVSTTLRNCLQ